MRHPHRRDILQLGAAALISSLLPAARVAAQKPRRILMLGGTGFLGPQIVHAALSRGHHVSMLNRGQRQPTQHADDFSRVEAIRGDRSQPDAYAGLAGKQWDIAIDTASRVPWTREAVAALKGPATIGPATRGADSRGAVGRYLYVSSTGVFFPYRTIDIPEDGPVLLKDAPPQDPPSYGVMKAQSENEARAGFGDRALIIRPGYIVGPGDATDRFTYWPMRMARGGEVLIPGRKTDRVQYLDVRDLAEWIVRLIEADAGGTFNAVGPAQPQTLAQFVDGLKPLAKTPVSYTWIEDYAWLKAYPLRPPKPGETTGLTDAIPWVMAEGDDLGHMRIDHRKAVAAGLTFRPLLTIARDTIAWRESVAVPEALRKQARYVLTPEQERAILDAWKARKTAPLD